MKLNEEVIAKLSQPIQQSWQCIAGDVLTDNPDIDNDEAIEMSIDADRLLITIDDVESHELINALVDEHDYIPVLEFLSKHISLV